MDNMKIINDDNMGSIDPRGMRYNPDKLYKKYIEEHMHFPIKDVLYYDLNPIYKKPSIRNLLVKDIYNQINDSGE